MKCALRPEWFYYCGSCGDKGRGESRKEKTEFYFFELIVFYFVDICWFEGQFTHSAFTIFQKYRKI